MNTKRNSNKYKIVIVFSLGLLLLSCGEDFLTVEPPDQKTLSEFWLLEEDVEAAMIGAYNSLQDCVWKLFVWGEMRGELLEVEIDEGSVDAINNHIIDQNNNLCKWGEIYSAINKVNTIIKFAPDVAEKDDVFTEVELNYYLGECKALRALLYFYLARTFETFPYTTESSATDEQDYQLEGVRGEDIYDLLIQDLLEALPMVRTDFPREYFQEKGKDYSTALYNMYFRGRITKYAVYAILTDIYLTKGEYQLAVDCADSIISSNVYDFMNRSEFLKIFSEGNTKESIFEIQFSETYNDESDIASWFVRNLGKSAPLFYHRINYNTRTLKYFEGESYTDPDQTDLRGFNKTYVADDREIVWKWAGLEVYQSNDSYRKDDKEDANWIIYRLADIILMKAEALNRLGRLDEAKEQINIIRDKANQDDIEAGTIESIEDFILDERARELVAEGKRWYDLVRIARRQNNYEVIANRIADAMAPPSRQSIWKSRVFNPLSWYFPIHKSELELNRNLVQNEYYEEAK